MKKKIVLICTLFLCVSVFANREGEWLVLENEYIEAVFDTKNGALVRMTDKNSGWEIMRREILGQSFELLLPLEGVQMSDADCRYNVIKGVEQAKPLIEQSNGRITFVWSGVKSELMDKPADIIFKGEVRMLDKGLEFSGSLINNSKYTVEYVSWPCIGEVTVPDKTQSLYQSTRNDIKGLFPHFSNRGAYWGIDYPTSTYIFPEKSFLQVNNGKEGFMIYNRTLSKHTIITSFELIPGFDKRNTNPYEDEMDGQLVRIQFKANHVLYNKAGDVSILDSLKLVTYSGTWTKGLKLYRDDCVANRYSISYEPRNFKGHLNEFPRVLKYGQQVDKLRKRYADFLWYAEFRDVLGAEVTGKSVRYTVFHNNKTGKKAVVAYNTDMRKSTIV